MNTEVGWANVHPLLVGNGWKYEQTVVWDKGIGHVAGNVNSKSIRRFPVVTEVFVRYTREMVLQTSRGDFHAKDWLRSEWARAGLPMKRANDACGVKDAATRKYFARDWLWYSPPPDVFARLVQYANENGEREGKPYFSIDGRVPLTAQDWSSFRGPWNHEHGLTNVWQQPALRGSERYSGSGVRAAPRKHNPGKLAATHLNQKPLALMKRLVACCTARGDVVWEPFGGLCSASVAAVQLGREPHAAESSELFQSLAMERLDEAMRTGELTALPPP